MWDWFVDALRSHPEMAVVLTLAFGYGIGKIRIGILLGVCSGAGTSAPSLAAVQEVARRKVPTLGYGVTYAVATCCSHCGARSLSR